MPMPTTPPAKMAAIESPADGASGINGYIASTRAPSSR
jgi:hypothetical protein